MSDKEVTIKIAAKNLTEAEFKKVQKGLGALGTESDNVKSKTSGLQRGFESFGRAAPGVLKVVTAAAAATAGAVVGITAAIIKLGERGAVVGDVQSAFDSLSTAAGETGETMLGALQRGVKGTVTNFELMRLANTALGAGLLTTSKDAQTLAEGSRLLAKRTGGDTAQAFQTLTTAMASGRTAQLKQLGLFVDSKKAVEEYAEAQGKSVSELTDVDRATALQVATMAALRGELEQNAPPLADFGELIERGKVGVKNLVDELAVMISNSPMLLAGMNAAGDAIELAFGGETSGLVGGVVSLIERAAVMALSLGQAGLTAADYLYRGFSGVKVLFLGIAVASTEVGKRLAELVAFTAETATKIPGLGKAYDELAVRAREVSNTANAVNESFKEQISDAALAATGHSAFAERLAQGKEVLNAVQVAMVNAGSSQRELTAATADGTVKTTELTGAVTGTNFELQNLVPVMVDWKGKLVDAGDESTVWAGLTKGAFSSAGEGARSFGATVSGVGDLVNVRTQMITDAFTRMGIATRADLEETVRQAEEDYKLIEESGVATAKQLAEAWKKVEEARRKNSDETTQYQLSNEEALLQGTTSLMQTLGAKFKAVAIAGAIISTYQAIAKALAAAAPPFNFILAAAAAAAGFANVAKIRSSSPGFRTGTEGLDFQDFGPTGRLATLHGREAIIPEGSGHMLAREMATEMRRGGSSSSSDLDRLAEGMDRGFAAMKSLPRQIRRAMRDGMLLAQ